jgi:hypothetical protein
MLNFNDGMSFDTTTPLHVERRRDGYYVVGDGMMFAVDTYEEGQREIAGMLERQTQAEYERILRINKA